MIIPSPAQLEQVFTQVFPLLTATIGYLGGQFIPGFTNEWFTERSRKRKHTLEIARSVHKICVEAESGSFIVPPRSYEHVKSVMVDLAGIDHMLSLTFNKFIELWIKITNFHAEYEIMSEQDFLKEKNKLIRNATLLSGKLTAWSNTIRAGK